jgi:hypothetical protein
MLEQWEADRLLSMPKIYTHTATVNLAVGVDDEYELESADGTEFFILDVRRPKRNTGNMRFMLRYQRTLVLARLCNSKMHTNPDEAIVGFPHLHRFREDFGVTFAKQVGPFADAAASLSFFCQQLNIDEPVIQGGLT